MEECTGISRASRPRPDDPNKAGGEPAQEKEEARKEAAAIVTNTVYIWSLALAVLALLLYIYWFR